MPQDCSTEISTTEIGSIQVGFGHINLTQFSPTQVDISHVNLNLGTTQVNSTQVTASQSFVTVTELNTNKISLKSSVTSQQFFNGNSFPLHTFTPESITTINSTAQTLRNNLLAPETPFYINLQLTSSLAKGQLAEAIVTKKTHFFSAIRAFTQLELMRAEEGK